MKINQNSILMYGHDEHVLSTRQWVLQTRGYRVLTVQELSGIAAIPQTPSISLILLCHSLSEEECDAAIEVAQARWPQIKSLTLDADGSRAPSGLLGQLLHTMDGPAKLIALVGKLIGTSPQMPVSSRT